MKYNVIKLIRNTQEQYVAQVETFDSLSNAQVNYHNTLASFHNADDVKIATVKIEDEFGHELTGFSETVNHTEVKQVTS